MEKEMDLSYKSFKEILISIIVGASIGLSVIVPGISGSTIAIVMKVYDKMMYAFSNLFKKFKACFLFLIPIGIGVLAGFGVGLVAVRFLLEHIPFITICFFVGLMVGTYPILTKEIKGEKPTINRRILFVAGMLVPLLVTLVSMFVGGGRDLNSIGILEYLLFLIIGVLISLTQIVPGLSATVLLMIFGYYAFLLDNIGFELLGNFKLLMVYVTMVIGFVIGILLFSKVINRLLDRQKTPFFFAICGLSLGSMIAVFFGNECLDIYAEWTVQSMAKEIIFGVISFAVAFAGTILLYIYDKKKSEKARENEKIEEN